MELDRTLTVEEAHAKTEAFEADLRRAHPGLGRITTHQEPAHASTRVVRHAWITKEQVKNALLAANQGGELCCRPHDIEVANADGELVVTCHCLIDPSASIAAAHDLTQKLEQGLRAQFPQVARVVIHMEPESREGN
jgi:divalent metal cation (Fe/Co/Zn/Cd) transporter